MAERFRWSKEDLEVYDYWSMKLQDERGALAVAERRGLEAGRKEGIAEGEKVARLANACSMPRLSHKTFQEKNEAAPPQPSPKGGSRHGR